MAAADGDTDDRVAIETLCDGGLRIDDRIDRRNYTVRTGGDVDPSPADDDRFRYPIDVAVAFSTDRLEFSPTGAAFVHEADSSMSVDLFDRETFPAGTYTVEMSGPLKLYVEVSGPCTVENKLNVLTVEMDPTLRGHPPAVAVGDEFSVPAGLEAPTGPVHVEVPADLEYVLPVASLAYYLGARVEPGEPAAVVVDGRRYPLDDGGGFERGVERTLKRTFFLDCLVRTVDKRETPLSERETLEDGLEVDLEALYGRPAAERFERYMEVPHGKVEGEFPNWGLTAHVQSSEPGIEALPFLANDLAVVRVYDDLPAGSNDEQEALEDAGDVVRPPEADSIDQAWVGPGVPVGASKTIPEAYWNWQEREPADDDAVEVAVVCNDEGMLEEGDTASEAYGSNLNLPFEVTLHDDLDVESLRLVLESDLDYVHYVGHVNDDGFECADGTLDAETLDTVGVDIAFLNACRSYDQGYRLTERGAVGAVVTFDDVYEEGALRIGKTMARLLNRGFPLRRALSIARDRSIVGSQYLVLGDGNADIAQARGLIPWVTEVDSVGPDEYRLRITTHPARSAGMGSAFWPAIGEDSVFLAPKTLPPVEVSTDRLREYLDSGSFPVVVDGRFGWSRDLLSEL
ncbi:hypothetical protein BRC63_00500 [Halobacteriales archaeon QH_10_70_21]|nr:MAG: hypothetical protein BRC63_00500 [Halobacteriales archaeon QH_10_70_21]